MSDESTLPQNYNEDTQALYGAYDLAIDRPDVTVAVRQVGKDYETKLRCGKRWSARYVRVQTVGAFLSADASGTRISDLLKHAAENHYRAFLKTLDRGKKQATMVDGAGATITMYDDEGC